MKIRGLGRKENRGIHVDQKEVLTILENSFIELYGQAILPEHLEVTSEEEATADEKGHYICAVKWKKNYQDEGDVDVPAAVLRLLGEYGLKLRAKLKNNIYETGEWPRDFTEAAITDLKKKPQATKFGGHRKISLFAHTAKIVERILRSKIEKKLEWVIGDKFWLRRGKWTRDAFGMLGTILEWALDIKEKFCTCFIDWQSYFTVQAGSN